ncbi:hypothetical protein PMM47T1_20548 [Pseudomonas sp. M47T1]|uniref:hypothetical protein n=1 Tax=unclassified Pseudomonas TaxID=196821 RepID=UPI0002606FD9|nr:hypothetical protein [Pseudomonas sp. M47T1]EIK94724.1 hypothetical protein PMM47T1_20548 [Pseudomonas sp. M47T1]
MPDDDDEGQLPCASPQLTTQRIAKPDLRREMVKLSSQTLHDAREVIAKVPASAYRELCLYILKYKKPMM